MITKTEAVVLKSMNYRDSSKIVTFYTRRFGKVKCLAKGARQAKSKFGAGLEPITNVLLVLYKKENRELQLVSQCDAVKTYKRINSELERMAVALAVLELVNQLAHDEEENKALYDLLVETLDEIERAGKNFVNLFFAFEIRCASIFGYSPDIESCMDCGRKLDEIGPDGSAVFQLSRGSVICGPCSSQVGVAKTNIHLQKRAFQGIGEHRNQEDGNTRISLSTLKILHRFLTARLESVASVEFTAAAGNEIDGTLRLYLRQHFEDLKPIKSLDILRNFVVSEEGQPP
ncbi:MAG: DNA repair protein RecO [Ignavibacteriales bacterium]|nr:DNA repair protein RecO [Ignavibacteriales bacterium]